MSEKNEPFLDIVERQKELHRVTLQRQRERAVTRAHWKRASQASKPAQARRIPEIKEVQTGLFSEILNKDAAVVTDAARRSLSARRSHFIGLPFIFRSGWIVSAENKKVQQHGGSSASWHGESVSYAYDTHFVSGVFLSSSSKLYAPHNVSVESTNLPQSYEERARILSQSHSMAEIIPQSEERLLELRTMLAKFVAENNLKLLET